VVMFQPIRLKSTTQYEELFTSSSYLRYEYNQLINFSLFFILITIDFYFFCLLFDSKR
jgi:hypothetical protein